MGYVPNNHPGLRGTTPLCTPLDLPGVVLNPARSVPLLPLNLAGGVLKPARSVPPVPPGPARSAPLTCQVTAPTCMIDDSDGNNSPCGPGFMYLPRGGIYQGSFLESGTSVKKKLKKIRP